MLWYGPPAASDDFHDTFVLSQLMADALFPGDCKKRLEFQTSRIRADGPAETVINSKIIRRYKSSDADGPIHVHGKERVSQLPAII